jgi:uncharacterized phage infection (PIP) family protein YhgE
LKNNKKTFAGEGDCRTTEMDRYGGGLAATVYSIDEKKRQGEKVSDDDWVDIGYTIWEFCITAASAIPYTGSLIQATGNLVKRPDKKMLCLSQLSDQINNGFKNIENLINKNNEEILKKIDELKASIDKLQESVDKMHADLKLSELRNSFKEYKEEIKARTHSFNTDIQELMSPRSRFEKLLNDLKGDCESSTIGIRRIAVRFMYYLKDSCEQKRHKRYSSNVTNFKQILTNHRKSFGNAKYSDSSDVDPCFLKTFGNIFKNQTNIKKEFFYKIST